MSKSKTSRNLKNPKVITSLGDAENDIKFELELCWCVQQLENMLHSGKLSQKVGENTIKNLNILKSSNTPLIRKRQVMKLVFGDYRAKMKEEEKKNSLAAKQIVFTSPDVNKKYSFLKKSSILKSKSNFSQEENTKDELHKERTSSDGDFRFNFIINELNDLSVSK